MEEVEIDFSGKYVCVVSSSKPAVEGVYIHEPRLENQGGRLFLVGGFVAVDNRFNTVPYAIAWDCVETYIVGDSLQQLADLFAVQSNRTENTIQALVDERKKSEGA